ncbi:MAG TPA: electron transfer flavoprotein subunit alpha/FixB family protein, partial [Myxococcales bacterium]|nr:electron transfer flavoprotein subunit alpha/FixB family protein [Myxococcales bacterium]
MATILVVGEQASGHLKKATLSALAAAQQLSQKTGGQVAGLVIGAGAGQAAEDLSAYGIPVQVVEGA